MNLRAIMAIVTLVIRLVRQINQLRQGKSERRAKQPARPASVLSRAVRRQAAPPAPARSEERAVVRARRSARPLGWTLRMLFAAGVAGSAAYLAMRQQERRRARRRPIHAPFPEELLDVLAPPGGEGSFFLTGDGLIDVTTDAFYPIVDGIPDFGGPRHSTPDDWTPDLTDMLLHGVISPLVWQANRAGTAALAGAVAAKAYDGWCLSVPCGTGLYEIEMARANPHARFVCVDAPWAMLLEARRKSLEAGLANLYFVRGDAELLPLKNAAFDGVWSAHGLPQYAHPERAVMQLARAAKPAAVVAGVSLVPGGPPLPDLALRLLTRRMPGLRDIHVHLSLLAASGLRELRAVRDGATVRFLGTRAA
jgi:SAM-dependent methyltransferase